VVLALELHNIISGTTKHNNNKTKIFILTPNNALVDKKKLENLPYLG
jgi:hypothetical protein